MEIKDWKSGGRDVTVGSHRVFVHDTGPSDKPALVMLHGYPTSSHDFHLVLPALAEHYRVVVHDHIGFGLSSKPKDYSYSIMEQADVALMVWRELGIESASIVAHDYGTSVGTEILARWTLGFRPIELKTIVFCNGSMHIELANLRIIQRLLLSRFGDITAKFTNRRIFDRNMRKLWHDDSNLSDNELAIMWELLNHDDGLAVFPQITHYLSDRRKFWNRWIGALKAGELPTAFVWGTEDPVVGGDVAQLHHDETPNSQLRLLENVGHYPMIEAPDRWVEAVLDVL